VEPLGGGRRDRQRPRCGCRRFHTVVDTAGLDEDRARDRVVVRELVNILWNMEEGPADQDWITTALAIAKAVQD
jgi:streptomycin 6-kinase